MMVAQSNNSMPGQTMMERLVFAKTLHKEAIHQSHRRRPYSSMSVLAFHDAIELFLFLAAEEVDTKNDSNLISCCNNIEQKTGEEIAGKAGIDRLRKARTNLKHYATRPDESEIASFRATAEHFFVENTPKIFGISYDDISMTELVGFEDARLHLQKAKELWRDSRKEEAMGQLALAHHELIHEYKNRVRLELDYSPVPEPAITNWGNSELQDDVNDALNMISKVLLYIGNGIEYPRFSRFDYLIPDLRHNHEGDSEFGKYRPSLEKYSYNEFPEDSFEYCYDFLIELALSLQNSDFDFDSDPESNVQSAAEW